MPEQLGSYTLEEKIATGGMAEIFLATDRNGRSCVIKRMLASMREPQFAQMFLDEAKLVAQLNHPSLAQIYDFGEDKGVLYLAMEWVEGSNLRAIVKDFAKRREMIRVEYCARLISQAALALGYAHQASGIDGKPLRIIHRDVSPQNILLSIRGAVKLIDFGVAKASSSSMVTAAGMIKGKFAYMSPEQLRGDPLDGRSDIFGLGLVLYELLAAERAVPGSTEPEIAQNALMMKFPPIENKRPDVPAVLRAILSKALQRDRSKRYDSAEQMAADLENFIAPRMPDLAPRVLAQLIPDAQTESSVALGSEGSVPPPTVRVNPIGVQGTESYVPTKTTVQEPAFIPPPSSGESWNSSPSETAALRPTQINPPGLMPKQVAKAHGALAQPQTSPSLGGTEPALEPPRHPLRWLLLAIALAALAVAGAWHFTRTSVHAEDVAPQTAQIDSPAVNAAPTSVAQLPAALEPEPPAPPSDAKARLILTGSTPSRVRIDGSPAGKIPLELTLDAGTHELLFEELSTKGQQTRTIELKPGEERTEDWKPERGRVVVRAAPWAEVFLAGKSLGVTPLDPIPLIEGRYTFSFVNSETERRDERVVEVKANADTMVKVDLRQAK
jgi:serine/threonine protein kinase